MSEEVVIHKAITRFHTYHGNNIRLREDNTVAYRTSSFADGLAFSEKPLLPGEIFLIEIEKIERGWSGNMRLGLTQLDIERWASYGYDLPQYALPVLTDTGASWVYAVTESPSDVNKIPSALGLIELSTEVSSKFPLDDDNNIRTCRGTVPKSLLRPSLGSIGYSQEILPSDVGSRIGVMYIPNEQGEKDKAEMYFIVNGEVQGPCSTHIPCKKGPIHAVVDVYGRTKRVKIVQLYGITSLQGACRDVIRQHLTSKGVSALPLPKALKEYLLYQS